MSLSRMFISVFAIAALSSANLPALAQNTSQDRIEIQSIQLVELSRCRQPNIAQCVSVKWRAIGDFPGFIVQLRGRNMTEDRPFTDFNPQRINKPTARETLFGTFLNSTDTLQFEGKVNGLKNSNPLQLPGQLPGHSTIFDQLTVEINQS